MSSINETIRGVLAERPGLPDSDVAAAVMAKVTKRDLLPLITDAVRNLRRADVRRVESRAVGLLSRVLARGKPRKVKSGPVSDADAKARVELLLRKAWATGDGRVAEISRMTLDELRARKELLERQLVGTRSALAIVDEAIAVVEGSGVTCLGELTEGAVA